MWFVIIVVLFLIMFDSSAPNSIPVTTDSEIQFSVLQKEEIKLLNHKPSSLFYWKRPIIKPTNPSRVTKMVCQSQRVRARILRGTRVNRNDFIPWRVRIGTNPESREPHEHCGGTIISSQMVLTAAHCVEPFADLPFFIYYDTISPNDKRNTKFAQADGVSWHHEYKGRGHQGPGLVRYEHDIALLHFPTHLDFSGQAKPTCLPWSMTNFPPQNISNKVPLYGIVSGWGVTRRQEYPSERFPQSCDLLHVTMSAISTKECNNWYRDLHHDERKLGIHPFVKGRRYPQMELTDDMFCAVAKDTKEDLTYPEFGFGGFCFGDSGGGFDYTENGNTYTVGIISTVYLGICGQRFPNKLIKITSYLDWLSNFAKSESMTTKVLTD